MSASIEVRGLSGLAANFRTMDGAAKQGIRKAMRERGEAQHAATVAECPKRTGFMASKTRLEFSPEGLTYDIGYHAEDFEGAGLAFYAQFVIYGTSRMAANDFLFRVHEFMRQDTTRAIGDELRASFERFRV